MESSTSRRVAILSDSRDSSRALAHCADADILIHEATNACLQRDRETGRGPELVEMQTVRTSAAGTRGVEKLPMARECKALPTAREGKALPTATGEGDSHGWGRLLTVRGGRGASCGTEGEEAAVALGGGWRASALSARFASCHPPPAGCGGVSATADEKPAWPGAQASSDTAATPSPLTPPLPVAFPTGGARPLHA
eukprot:scaffold5143_cov119-Isochrysis_galbana.AAC.10